MGCLGILSSWWLGPKRVSRDRKWELPVLGARVQKLAKHLFYRIHLSGSLKARFKGRGDISHLGKRRVKELGVYINYLLIAVSKYLRRSNVRG